MTTYLLHSTVCLVIILLLYKSLLERERIHQFNRFYLLIGLGITLGMPLLDVVIPILPTKATISLQEVYSNAINQQNLNPQVTNEIPSKTFFSYTFLLTIYFLGLGIFLFRFLRNLFLIYQTAQRHPKIKYEQQSLVLIEEKTSPYSFGNYIFVNADDFHAQRIHLDILQHELVHVRQRHTLDILFIEFIQAIFWFNPLYYFYKKNIQLNHEFLADQAVLKNQKNIKQYQQLLLNISTEIQPRPLVSASYTIIKKRLIMMTKKTSSKKQFLIIAMSCLVLFILAIGVSTKITAQNSTTKTDTTASSKQQPTETQKQPISNSSNYLKDCYYTYHKEMRLGIKDKDGKVVQKKYSELSNEEKVQLPMPDVIPKPERMTISESQLEDFKNSKKYGVWLDEKKITNETLNDYAANDFKYYMNSRLMKNAKNYGEYTYHLSLYTEEGYQELVKSLFAWMETCE